MKVTFVCLIVWLMFSYFFSLIEFNIVEVYSRCGDKYLRIKFFNLLKENSFVFIRNDSMSIDCVHLAERIGVIQKMKQYYRMTLMEKNIHLVYLNDILDCLLCNPNINASVLNLYLLLLYQHLNQNIGVYIFITKQKFIKSSVIPIHNKQQQ